MIMMMMMIKSIEPALSHARLTVSVFSCGDAVSCIQGIPLQNIGWERGHHYWGIRVFTP